MFDILLFLYDNYLVSELHPDAEVLSRKLSAAGFEADDIDRALDWLSSLDQLDHEEDWQSVTAHGHRVYTESELCHLDPEGIGFLAHLEHAGLLSPRGREWVIDQAMALDEEAEVPAEKIKWITLMAVSRLYGHGDALWLEDLVRGGEDGWRPTIH